MDKLLAKSGDGAPTLAEHTRDVMDAAESLFGTAERPTRLGECWLRFFKLPRDIWPVFCATLRASVAVHDWGKANDQMQEVLAGSPVTQSLRHEHLSGLLLAGDSVWEWVGHNPDIDREVLLSAVLSHHLKFDGDAWAEPVEGGRDVQVLYHDTRFVGVLDATAKAIGREDRPSFPLPTRWAFRAGRDVINIESVKEKVADRLWPLLQSDASEVQLRLLRAVRAGLIAADAAGSGLRRVDVGQTVGAWVGEQFSEVELCDEALIRELICNRIGQLQQLGKTYRPQQFQDDCRRLPDRALLLAPCGSGKTLAAWRWIESRLTPDKHGPVKRVLFLYPTRATATEGFKDYVSWAPEGDPTLIHSSAAYELEGMFPDVSDPRARGSFASDPRLYAVGYWSKRVFSATVDTFLAFMGHAYGPTCLLPVLADSIVVIDEVHSFDESMFSKLLGFLRSFDIPVLCMTATLSQPRIAAIRAAIAATREADETLTVYGEDRMPADLRAIAGTPRYQVRQVPGKAAALDAVKAAMKEETRVLWVVNQVRRAQELTRELGRLFPEVPIHCYHSRFTLDDRKTQHERVVTAFKTATESVIGVVTQVCEMSLDLDADLLVTEVCPITSLIQRMGRCRRDVERLKSRGPGEVVIYPFDKPEPYSPEDLSGVEAFLKFVTREPAINQQQLEAGLREYRPKTPLTERQSSFLDSGPYAVGGADPFRDIEQYTRQAVLSTDVTAYLRAPISLRDGYVLPVPSKAAKRLDPAPAKWPQHMHVADAAGYDELTGFWYPRSEEQGGV